MQQAYFLQTLFLCLWGVGVVGYTTDTDSLSAQREMLAVLAPVDHSVSSHSLTIIYCQCVHKHTHAWPQTSMNFPLFIADMTES